MEGESGEQVGGELESVTSLAGCFVQGWRNETAKIILCMGVDRIVPYCFIRDISVIPPTSTSPLLSDVGRFVTARARRARTPPPWRPRASVQNVVKR